MDQEQDEEIGEFLEVELKRFMAELDEVVDMYDIMTLSDGLRSRSRGGTRKNYQLFKSTKDAFLKVAEQEANKHMARAQRRIKIYIEALMTNDIGAIAKAKHKLRMDDDK